MPYPIITPDYFEELHDENNPDNNGVAFTQLTTPDALEMIFPHDQERVIRRLMAHPEPMTYKMINLPPEDEPKFAAKGEELKRKTPALRYYWNLKTITMNMLQDRRYTLDQRLLLLNFVYKTVDTMFDKKREDAIDPFIGQTMRENDHSEIIKYFQVDSVKPNPELSLGDGLTFLRSLPESEEVKKLCTITFKNYKVSQDMKGFSYTEEHEKIRQTFAKIFKGDMAPVKGEEEDIDRTFWFEQIMVNYVWTYCMPFADFRLDLWSNYIFFNIIYNALKVIVAGYTYESDAIDEDFIFAVKTFDSALRAVKGSIVARIKDANDKQGLSNNGDMAILTLGW
ncbi:MAG: hypothetical protein IKR73_04350 [Oscillospiraceae bacterium]|nr:hypothetical protein [Oscillospiraceae bacterium]